MMERDGLIIVEKQRHGLTSILVAILLVVSIGTALTVFKVTPIPDWNIQESKRVSIPFIAAIFAFELLLVFSTNFILSFSYKIDLIKNELTYFNHLPFWTKTKNEKIVLKKITEVGQEKGKVHGSFIKVQINGRTIKVYDNVHIADIKSKVDYLKKYGFQS